MLNRNPSLHKYVFRPKDKDQFELEWYLTHRLLWLYQIVEHTCHQHQAPSSYHIHWRWPQLVRSQRKASSWEIWKNWNSRHREIGPVKKIKNFPSCEDYSFFRNVIPRLRFFQYRPNIYWLKRRMRLKSRSFMRTPV